MSFVWSRMRAIAQKEIYHIMRDPFTLALSLGLPVFLVFVFGLAIEFNVKNIHLAIYDADQSQSSRRLADVFGSSGYFINHYVNNQAEAQQNLLNNKDRAALLIPG